MLGCAVIDRRVTRREAGMSHMCSCAERFGGRKQEMLSCRIQCCKKERARKEVDKLSAASRRRNQKGGSGCTASIERFYHIALLEHTGTL